MNIEQFQDLVDRFGEAPAGWPADLRAQAVRFLAGSPEAQDIVAEAAELRAMFRNDVVTKAPAGLSDRIFASAGRSEQWRPISVQPISFEPMSLRQVSGRQIPIAAGGALPSILASGSGRPFGAFKEWRPGYFVLASLFVIGLGIGIGLGFAPSKNDGHIDFATMFAIVGT
jgi:hypothetical protein